MRPMVSTHEYIPARSDTPIFVFGDHASRHIPDDLDNLGLTGADLTRHIAWDIGTETTIRYMCKTLECAGLLAGFSRLVIDPNRSIDMDSLIPIVSDGTPIPGNQNLSDTEKQARIDQYYTPYHAALSKYLDGLPVDPIIISVHSFTPELKTGGPDRDLDIGLLVKQDDQSMEAFKAILDTRYPELTVKINEPYSAFDLNRTVDVHVAARGLRHLNIEINQALCHDDVSTIAIAEKLTDAIRRLHNQNELRRGHYAG